MTERKPREMSIPSWIDKQIQDATERGAFDNLPGSGKPLKNRGAFSTETWVRDYLRREGVPGEDALPTPLRLRKESERLAETVHLLRSEQEVRNVVTDLNDRIRAFRKLPEGPPVIVRLVDEDEMLRRWRENRPAPPAPTAAGPAAAETSRRRRLRWRRGPSLRMAWIWAAARRRFGVMSVAYVTRRLAIHTHLAAQIRH
jgi:hypothetical protein